ncbi:MAG: arsenite methyltransferase [Candidatus Krumholzibacteriia bacterium]
MTTRRPADPQALRDAVSQGYGKIARASGGCGCCGGSAVSPSVGYTSADLAAVPAGADLGLGCGAPVGFAQLQPGETVLDLGSGAGLDAFLAAREVGPEGRVIGVDMTEAMLEKARRHAAEAGLANVEFRQGLIEELPLDDASVDVILSNCVINLSPEKGRVFREAVRVLRPGGRMVISDIVLTEPLPAELAQHLAATIGCVGGAVVRADYLATAREAGFGRVEILKESSYGEALVAGSPLAEAIERDTALTMDEVARHLGKVLSVTVRLTR